MNAAGETVNMSRLDLIKQAAAKRAGAFAGAPAPADDEGDMVSLKEAAEQSGIHRSVLERMVRDGRLRHTRESERKIRVPLSEIQAAYAAHQAAVARSPKGGAAQKAKRGGRDVKPEKQRHKAKAPRHVKVKAAPASTAIVVYESPQAIAHLVRQNIAARLMTPELALAALLDRLDPPA